MTTPQQEPHGELEYGSILPNGDDWRLRRCDGGMGETEYRIFRNEKFFAMFDNRKDADIVMVAMTQQFQKKNYFGGECTCNKFVNCHDCRDAFSFTKSERDKVLDNIMELVDGRIEGLDDLLATPPEQRTESAQDKYLKEARFELGLVQDEYKELRQKAGDFLGTTKGDDVPTWLIMRDR